MPSREYWVGERERLRDKRGAALRLRDRIAMWAAGLVLVAFVLTPRHGLFWVVAIAAGGAAIVASSQNREAHLSAEQADLVTARLERGDYEV